MENNAAYPLTLPDDSRVEWAYDNIFKNGELVRCYFHDTKTLVPINMHYHHFYEINIIVRGQGRHYIGSQSFPAQIGDVFVIPPMMRHGYWSQDNLVIFHALISQAFLNKYDDTFSLLPGFNLLFKIEPFIRKGSSQSIFLRMKGQPLMKIMKEMQDLCDIQNSDYPERQIMKNAKTLYLISSLSHYIALEHHQSETQKLQHAPVFSIVKCLEYIHLHFYEKITTEELCNEFKISRSTLFRNFQKICQMSPYDYQLKCRMDYAKQQLLYSNDTVLDIALACGFFDSSHFIRIFTRKNGMSPQAYRKKGNATIVQ